MLPELINSRLTEIQVKKERDQVDKIIDAVKDPSFDISKLAPEDYKLLEKYQPQVAAYVAEKAPTLVTASGEGATQGRAAQMAALDRYRQLGQTGDDSQSRIMRDQALQAAQVQNQGQQASIMDKYAQQGQGGSGNQLIAQLMAQQNAGRNAQQSSQQAASDSYNQRLQALKEGASLGGTVRNEDVNLEGQNANILNSYNQRFAANQNLYNQYAANTNNDASKYNINMAQTIADRNVGQRNQAASDYQNRYNASQQQQYQNAMDRAGQVAGNQNARIDETKGVAADRENINRQGEQDVISIMGYGSGGNKQNKNAGGQGSASSAPFSGGKSKGNNLADDGSYNEYEDYA